MKKNTSKTIHSKKTPTYPWSIPQASWKTHPNDSGIPKHKLLVLGVVLGCSRGMGRKILRSKCQVILGWGEILDPTLCRSTGKPWKQPTVWSCLPKKKHYTHCFLSKMTLLKHFLGWQKRFPTLLNKRTEEVAKGLLIGLKKKKHTFWPWEIWTKLLPGLKFIPPKTDESVRKKYPYSWCGVVCWPRNKDPKKNFSPNGPSKNTPPIGSLIFVFWQKETQQKMFGRCWCWKKNNRKNSISRKQNAVDNDDKVALQNVGVLKTVTKLKCSKRSQFRWFFSPFRMVQNPVVS